MRYDVLTIFPEMIRAYLKEGILARAAKRGLIEVQVTDIRAFAGGAHKNTDDRPFGGGDGMVMKPGPIYRALDSVPRVEENSLVLLLTPQGKRFDQEMAWELSRQKQLILVCGRYEGIDERIRELCVDRELSIGDYVLSGGELAALVLMDAVSRLVPGVLGGQNSTQEDSFEDGLLEYPHYTRPRVFMGREVPEILLSGDHEKIRQWRRAQSLKRTLEKRPDLLQKAQLTGEDGAILEKLKEGAEKQ
ncbi:MAG: tRNA (guanosine(37)-N1)-methyltransferase TrmD [Deltaproteobacteria bacterium]|nr:MAG: tRNA (guanosine(37)-N1)-methyltransferase TrmD [Desulfobacteraceae bacterium 4484_190.3]RLB19335.1 MAG: tRNA (guanosine(37)-N1)-methyltransferase TrmD [Deltaproteobacteria bacterium]